MENSKAPASKKKTVLGRGLSALLDDSDINQEKAKNKSVVNTIFTVPLSRIEVNPYQPRVNFDQDALEELANSIKTQGIIQPITVRSVGGGQFQLISGERRVQASRIAGLHEIPAYVRTANDQQMLEMALIENIQRENLNSMEIAQSYQRLISECALKQEELGDRVGKNRTTVNNYLRLLRLPPKIQSALRDNQISMGHARAIINVDSIDQQLFIFETIIKNDLSVRKVEELVRNLGKKQKPSGTKDNEDTAENVYQIKQLQNKLSSHFGTKVMVRNSAQNKGEIRIPYISADDLNRILELLDL